MLRFHFKKIMYIQYFEGYVSADKKGESKRTLPPGPWFLIKTQRRIWGLNHSGNKFIAERTEKTPQRSGKTKKGTALEWWGMGFFKSGLLCIHLGRRGLTFLIDSCRLHNNRLYCACLPHTWHSSALRKPMMEFEKSLWLVCLYCALGHITWVGLEKFLWLFVAYLWILPQPHQACLGGV